MKTCHSICSCLNSYLVKCLSSIITFTTLVWSTLNISHLQTFGCDVNVSIAPPQYTKMSPQHRLEICIGYNSPSIMRYLEPLTCDVFTARLVDCHFNGTHFQSLRGENSWLEDRHHTFERFSSLEEENRSIVELESQDASTLSQIKVSKEEKSLKRQTPKIRKCL